MNAAAAKPRAQLLNSMPAGDRCWAGTDGIHIDVRGLSPPAPLVRILLLIGLVRDDATAVIVHHDRDPVMLYPELAELGWTAERIEAPPGEVRLKLERAR